MSPPLETANPRDGQTEIPHPCTGSLWFFYPGDGGMWKERKRERERESEVCPLLDVASGLILRVGGIG
jgi:hypothetical protein